MRILRENFGFSDFLIDIYTYNIFGSNVKNGRKDNKKHRRKSDMRLRALTLRFLTALCLLLKAIVELLDD